VLRVCRVVRDWFTVVIEGFLDGSMFAGNTFTSLFVEINITKTGN
jgi:hypothetical protein